MDVRHDPDRNRFVADIEGAQAVLEYTEQTGDVLDYRRTFTPPPLRGQGIAKAVVLFALDHARDQGLRIVPTCPFVAKVVRENPVYADLIAE